VHHDALAKGKENTDGLILNIDGLIVRLSGDERILEKGKNDTRVGVTETNVHTNDYSTVRPFAPAFMSHCLEQAKVENCPQTSQIEKIWKKMHDLVHETVLEPAMHTAIQAALLLYASDLFTGIGMGEKERGLAHRAHLRGLRVAVRGFDPRPYGSEPHGASPVLMPKH
jgi:hypothetical protein